MFSNTWRECGCCNGTGYQLELDSYHPKSVEPFYVKVTCDRCDGEGAIDIKAEADDARGDNEYDLAKED